MTRLRRCKEEEEGKTQDQNGQGKQNECKTPSWDAKILGKRGRGDKSQTAWLHLATISTARSTYAQLLASLSRISFKNTRL